MKKKRGTIYLKGDKLLSRRSFAKSSYVIGLGSYSLVLSLSCFLSRAEYRYEFRIRTTNVVSIINYTPSRTVRSNTKYEESNERTNEKVRTYISVNTCLVH